MQGFVFTSSLQPELLVHSNNTDSWHGSVCVNCVYVSHHFRAWNRQTRFQSRLCWRGSRPGGKCAFVIFIVIASTQYTVGELPYVLKSWVVFFLPFASVWESKTDSWHSLLAQTHLLTWCMDERKETKRATLQQDTFLLVVCVEQIFPVHLNLLFEASGVKN